MTLVLQHRHTDHSTGKDSESKLLLLLDAVRILLQATESAMCFLQVNKDAQLRAAHRYRLPATGLHSGKKLAKSLQLGRNCLPG